DHEQYGNERPVEHPPTPSRPAAGVGARGLADPGGEAGERLVLAVAGARCQVREHLAEVIDVVVKAGHGQADGEPAQAGETQDGDQLEVAPPDEVGEKGERK